MPRYRVIRFARVAFKQEVEAEDEDHAIDNAFHRNDWTIANDDEYDIEVEEVRGL